MSAHLYSSGYMSTSTRQIVCNALCEFASIYGDDCARQSFARACAYHYVFVYGVFSKSPSDLTSYITEQQADLIASKLYETMIETQDFDVNDEAVNGDPLFYNPSN